MARTAALARSLKDESCWRDFIPGAWCDTVDVRDFIAVAEDLVARKFRIVGVLDLHLKEGPGQGGMVGLLPGRSVMSGRLTLGYRQAVALASCWLFDAREEIRGHEFHHSEIYGSKGSREIDTAYLVKGTHGTTPCAGFRYRNCVAGYVHLHFGSNPEFAESFVTACRDVES